jgi:hypothetical protein
MRVVYSSILDKISSAYFVDYLTVSDYKPIVVYCKKTTADESYFFYQKKKKKLLGRIGINVLNLKKKIYNLINLIFLVKN